MCDNAPLDRCKEHLYSVKGLRGCIDTGASEGTAFAVEFTVRDDALPPHITRVIRKVVIDDPCPAVGPGLVDMGLLWEIAREHAPSSCVF